MGNYLKRHAGLLVLAIMLITGIATAALRGSPFQPHDDVRFNAIESLGDTDGIQLADGDIVVGDSSGNMNAVTMSGDATIVNTGALTLTANSVDSDQYVDGSIDLIHMSVNSVDSDQYVDASIDLAHMSVNSIDSDQYVDASIDLAHMSVNSVDSDQYVDASIDSEHYAAGSVLEDDLAVPTADGLNTERTARATFDCGVGDCSVGTLASTVTLPANAMLLQTWFRIKTQFVDGGAGTVAIHCEDANNLFTATDITGSGDGTITAGALDGHEAADFLDAIAAPCIITMTIATAEQTAGIMNFYVKYVVHD